MYFVIPQIAHPAAVDLLPPTRFEFRRAHARVEAGVPELGRVPGSDVVMEELVIVEVAPADSECSEVEPGDEPKHAEDGQTHLLGSRRRELPPPVVPSEEEQCQPGKRQTCFERHRVLRS